MSTKTNTEDLTLEELIQTPEFKRAAQRAAKLNYKRERRRMIVSVLNLILAICFLVLSVLFLFIEHNFVSSTLCLIFVQLIFIGMDLERKQ